MTDILIVGATGRIGGGVADILASEGRDFCVMSTRPDEARRRYERVRPGDMRQPETLKGALDGIDAAFLVTPIGPDETECGMAFLDAAEAAGVRKIAYVGIHNIEAMAEIPHFATKLPVRERLLAGGPHTIADANFFMQNDEMAAPAIAHGVYPMPIGTKGVNAVDARDVSAVCARALTSDALEGQAVPVCGRDVVTGPSKAAAYAEALGRPVAYGGDDTGPFLDQLAANLPPMPPPVAAWVREDFRLMMEVTQVKGCLATDEDIAACEAALGRPQRSHTDYVAELVASL